MPDRIAEWQEVLNAVTARQPLAGGMRLEFGRDVDLGSLSALVGAEQQCCAFFAFAITVDQRGIGLEVSAPADALDVVTALFGQPAAPTR